MFLFGLNRRKERIQADYPHDTVLLGKRENSYDETSVEILCGFSGAAVSDVGCIRENNEDNYIFEKNINRDSSDRSEIACSLARVSGEWHFAGVFDGMGGGEMGELASRETAEIFLKAFDSLSEAQSKTEIDLALRKAFLEANNRIVSLQKEYKIFGTTGTVLCTNGAEIKIYHLGDSRAYLIHEDKLVQITKDQTLAQMKMEVGMYRENDPSAEADKHKLTEYIGRDRTKENIKPVESRWLPVQKSDRILLCSDGLYDMCADDEIARILCKNSSVADMALELVNTAKTNGGKDNITCIVVLFS